MNEDYEEILELCEGDEQMADTLGEAMDIEPEYTDEE